MNSTGKIFYHQIKDLRLDLHLHQKTNQLVFFFFFFYETNWCLGMMIKKLPLGLYEVMHQKLIGIFV